MDRNKLENHNGNSLKELTAEIEKLFQFYNSKYFENELPLAVITIQSGSQGRRKSNGWFIQRIWNPENNTEIEKVISEINLSAEILTMRTEFTKAPLITKTLLHEMIHLYNFHMGIKDTSTNGSHNKPFGIEAEKRGLKVIYTKKFPKIETPDFTEEGFKIYKESNFDESLLNKFRIGFTDITPTNLKSEDDEEGEPKEKKKKLKNLFCPECNSKAYTPSGNESIFICKGTEENPHEPSQLLEKV
jgi:hypothetical protein